MPSLCAGLVAKRPCRPVLLYLGNPAPPEVKQGVGSTVLTGPQLMQEFLHQRDPQSQAVRLVEAYSTYHLKHAKAGEVPSQWRRGSFVSSSGTYSETHQPPGVFGQVFSLITV